MIAVSHHLLPWGCGGAGVFHGIRKGFCVLGLSPTQLSLDWLHIMTEREEGEEAVENK